MALQSQASRDIANRGYDVNFWFKKSMLDLPFEPDAQRSKIYLHKSPTYNMSPIVQSAEK